MLVPDTRPPLHAIARATQDHEVELALAVQAMTHGLLAHHAQTAKRIDHVIAFDPGAAIGHATRAFALCLQMRTDLSDAIAAALCRAEVALHERGGTETERALTTAARAYANGRPLEALGVLDAQLSRVPTDLLALKLGHALHFLTGDTAGMLRAVDAAIAAQPSDFCGYSLGCQAFAHVEAGDVDGGERIGRRAVALRPDDAWGVHAVAHAIATRGDAREGIAWLTACTPALREVNNFAGHVAWHEALCRLSIGDEDGALATYDDRVVVHLGTDYRDMVNAATLLHRLRRRGRDVRDRAARLAAHALARHGDHGSAFGDVHYALAISDHDLEAGRTFARSMRHAAATRDTHEAMLARRVACDLVDAIIALRDGAHGTQLFDRSRASWPQLGGSRIQREMFDLLRDEAAAG